MIWRPDSGGRQRSATTCTPQQLRTSNPLIQEGSVAWGRSSTCGNFFPRADCGIAGEVAEQPKAAPAEADAKRPLCRTSTHEDVEAAQLNEEPALPGAAFCEVIQALLARMLCCHHESDAYGRYGFDLLVMEPDNWLRHAFDAVAICCVTYAVFVSPICAAFALNPPFGRLEYAVDAFFLLDMLIQCFYGFMDHGVPVLELKKSANRCEPRSRDKPCVP